MLCVNFGSLVTDIRRPPFLPMHHLTTNHQTWKKSGLPVRGIVGIRPDPMMFVGINCEDVAASKAFYEKLGFVQQVRHELDGGGVPIREMLQFRINVSSYILIPAFLFCTKCHVFFLCCFIAISICTTIKWSRALWTGPANEICIFGTLAQLHGCSLVTEQKEEGYAQSRVWFASNRVHAIYGVRGK